MKYLPLLLIIISGVVYGQVPTSDLNQEFNRLTKDPSYQNANVSFVLLNAQTGKILFDRNKDKALAPASTLKTFTTATALNVLGENYRYQTRVTFKGTVNNGMGTGDVIIYGSGDPSFGSDRFGETKPELIKKQILDALKKKGISTLKGTIKIVSEIFTDEAINTGWLDEDIGNYYGAGIYPLNWKENRFEINLIPTKASFDVSSNNAGYDNKKDFCIELVHKEGATTEEAFAYVEKNKPCMYVIKGVLSDKEKTQNMQLARLHPDEDFKKELSEYLKKELNFEWKESRNDAKENTLVMIQSPPLSQLVYWCNQKSLNLYAEAFCKTIAYKLFKKGSWPLGVVAMNRYANSKGINTKALSLKDGCGLAPENRITTYILAQLLQKDMSEPFFKTFYESLPSINGLIMKSGYIGGTRSYAGYIKLKDGTDACFAFIINNYNCTPKQVKLKMFQILDLLK